VQSLQPEQLLAVLKNTQQALGGNGGKAAINAQGDAGASSRRRAKRQRPRPAAAASAPARPN